MGRILGLELDHRIADAIRAEIRSLDDARLDIVGVQSGLRAVEAEPAAIEAVVVGHDAARPAQVAQRAFAAARDLPVLLLVDSAHEASLRGEIRLTPLIGHHVSCVLDEEPAEVAATVRETLEQARRRAQHHTTVSALNVRLAVAEPASTPAVEIIGRILSHAPIGVVVVNSLGTIVTLNPYAARLLRSTDGGTVGASLFDSFDPENASQLRRLVAEVREAADGMGTFGGLVGQPDARFEVSCAALPGGDGAPTFVILLNDITERIRLVDSERVARREAEEASRAKDEFMAMLGHELRNPLSPIVTALAVIRRRGVDPRNECELTVIDRQLTQLARLVEDLLDVSRIRSGKVTLRRAPVELSTVIARAVEQARPWIDTHRHALEVRPPPTGLIVDADADRLAQVLSNLLSNAAKYTPPGGRISVVADRDGEEVVVHVRDTGVGISPDLLPHIFDSFVQGKRGIDRSQGGLGLGLAIARNLVGLHGGTLRAHSQGLGRGSEFVVRLPAVSRPAAPRVAPKEAAPPRPPTAAPRARILVVDDNVDAATLLVAVLDSMGYEARAAYDGPTALALAPGFLPRIAILDIGLPGMDGYELARRLSELPALRPLRLLALSGYGQPRDRARSGEAGFEQHLVKPVDLVLLEHLLEQNV